MNYCFFNLLVMVLCLFCLEDAWWQKRKWFKNKPAESKSQWPRWIIVPLACVILVSSTSQMFWRVGFQNVFETGNNSRTYTKSMASHKHIWAFFRDDTDASRNHYRRKYGWPNMEALYISLKNDKISLWKDLETK